MKEKAMQDMRFQDIVLKAGRLENTLIHYGYDGWMLQAARNICYFAIDMRDRDCNDEDDEQWEETEKEKVMKKNKEKWLKALNKLKDQIDATGLDGYEIIDELMMEI
jgi:hypothetical protein